MATELKVKRTEIDVRYVADWTGRVNAVGDGVTDDTKPIQAAITIVNYLGGGVVFLPKTLNGYAVTSLDLLSGVTLRGENRVLLKKIGASGFNFIATGVATSDVRIENLTIDGAGLTTTRIVLVNDSTTNFTLSNCKVMDSGGIANLSGVETRVTTSDILIDRNLFDGVDTPIFINKGPARCTVSNNRLVNWKTRGIYVLGDAVTAVTDFTLKHNHISGNINTSGTRQPIAFIGNDALLHKRVKVNFNTVIGPDKAFTAADPGTADQISLHRCEDFEVIGNTSRGGGDMGITIAQQCRRGIVSENVCVENDVGGIAIGSATSTSCKDITLTGNLLMNNGQNHNADRADVNRIGMYIYNATNLSISGNRTGDDQGVPTQKYGYRLTNTAQAKFGTNCDLGNVIAIHYNDAGNTNCEKPANPQAVV